MKMYLLSFVVLISTVSPFYAMTEMERLQERIDELTEEKDKKEDDLFETEKVQLLYQHMTAESKKKTNSEWREIENRVAQYTLQDAKLVSGTARLINHPIKDVQDQMDTWIRRYEIPAKDGDAMKMEVLGETHRFKSKRLAFQKGQGGEVSGGKMVVRKRNSTHTDIGFSLETLKFNLTPKKVRCVEGSSTWLEIEFEEKEFKENDVVELGDLIDHRLNARFTNLYGDKIAYQNYMVRRKRRKVERLERKIKKYLRRMGDI